MSAPILHLSVSQKPVFLINSRLDLCTAAPGTRRSREHPFSRSYGVILPSSLTSVLPCVSESSSRPPVSVSGTGAHGLARGFSWQCRLWRFGTSSSLPIAAWRSAAGFAALPARRLGRTLPSVRSPHLPASPLRSIIRGRYRTIHLLSIAYAFRPRLRPRLTLSGRTFLRNPWAFDGGDSHSSLRYSDRHSHFQSLRRTSRSAFAAFGTLPYPDLPVSRDFGAALEPRYIFGAAPLDQ